ncbi:UDP-N-acetylmuramate dehydrogenase [Candidatus Saccharibacteria bacterium]|nr:MAG: UDP-N-acetylmuramate dehydrogenase [Candidatus Saccharibacteria bacterium]
MHIQYNVPLNEFSTMHLGGNAKQLIIISSKDELLQAIMHAQAEKLPLFVMGGGSNMIVRDEGFDGLVIVNRIPGFNIDGEDENHVTIKIGAGENWDDIVARCVDMNLSGIEAMSLIPGTTGATPVQNVGAYGQEIADTLVEVEAYDILTFGFVRLLKEECQFSYRNSIFKATADRRYIITGITIDLKKARPQPPFYGSLQKYFEDNGVDPNNVSPADVRKAVIAIRTSKLPDPKVIFNTGSFFKNPIVDATTAQRLLDKYPNMPNFPGKDGHVKLAAGWLIEQSGLKGYAKYGMKTYEQNALVLVNDGASSYADLAAFRDEIISIVEQKFGVTLEQEPELL